MQTMTLYLPPGLLLNTNMRPHWAQKAKITRDLRWIGMRQATKQLTPVTERQHVTVTYGFLDKRRRDPNNWHPTEKALIDGMVADAHILPGDDSRWLIGPDARCGEPTDRPGAVKVTITLEPAP